MANKNAGSKSGGNNGGMNKEVGVGIAVAAVAAAAAGAYFLYGAKDAKKNRKVVRGWMLRAKGEVLEKMENMKEAVTEDAYNKIVDTVAGKYGSMKNASAEEVEALSKELKSHWKNIQGHFLKPAKKGGKKKGGNTGGAKGGKKGGAKKKAGGAGNSGSTGGNTGGEGK